MVDLSGFKNLLVLLKLEEGGQELLEAKKEEKLEELLKTVEEDQELLAAEKEDQELPRAVKGDKEEGQKLLEAEEDEEIVKAVKEDQVHQVRRLLEKGADPNQRDKAEKGPVLSWATSVPVANLLIDKGANMDSRDDKPQGWTALHWAIFRKMPDVVELLARRGAKLLPTLDSSHCTPLQWLSWAKDSGGMQCEMLKYILTSYPDSERLTVIEELDWQGFTLLTRAATCGEEPIVRQLLELGANVNQRNVFLYTALHQACRYGYRQALITLLEKGADIDSLDGCQRTPLMHAAQSGHLGCVEELIKRGANVSLEDISKQSLLAFAALSGSLEMWQHVQGVVGLCHPRDVFGRMGLHFACQSGNPDMVREFLKNGYTPEADEHGRNALIHATIGPKANPEVISLLLEEGVPNLPDNNGWTASRWAAEAGNEEIYTLIQNARSDEAQHDIIPRDESAPTKCDNCQSVCRSPVLLISLQY
jgi:ankyrin repeat protein